MPPPITDDYALWLDMKIATLDRESQKVIAGLFFYRKSVSAMARHLRCRKESVRALRDSAVNELYQMLDSRADGTQN